MTRTRYRFSLLARSLPCPLYLLIVFLSVKLLLADPQRLLRRNSNPNFGDGLFMVGNSYTSVNNLPEIITNMLERSSISSYPTSGVKLPLKTETWSLDGAKWKDYAFALGSQYHVPPTEFRWAVLQEQSQIPGLFQSNYFQNEWRDSAKAVQLLDSNIQKVGNLDHTTQTILFQTWGRLDFSTVAPQLAVIYDSFPSHQSLIATGYKEYQRLISTAERPVIIAPVGFAFQAIYDSMVKEGLDPTKEGGRFASLYQTIDGSHPSAQGSYLAASVLVGILTGQDPQEFDWDYPLVPYDTQKNLREVAHTTIANYCKSEYCNPKPSKDAAAGMDPFESSPSFFSRNSVRFLFVAGVFLAVKKRHVGKKNT